MADEDLTFVDEVSEFLRKSCPQRATWRSELARYLYCPSYQTHHPDTGLKCKGLRVHTGSAAELFIDPLLSCIDDVDVMYHYSNELAIPRSHPPPRQLPADFDKCVRVFELVDSHPPGYVYLAFAYTLTKSDVDGKYLVKYVERSDTPTFLDHDLYMYFTRSTDPRATAEIHGPAHKTKHDLTAFSGLILHTDAVPCIRCFKWPPQATDWPTRYRIHGWPNKATIDAVVRNGCDVVGVAHPLCKGDQWMAKYQWRLSFSRAEVTLLHTWTLVQQILYHMLRTFVKTERLTKGSNNYGTDTLSNYHIKMLMLWACEKTPQHWWTNESNLVSMCVKLMHYMNEWITKRHGQHFFINDVNFCFSTTDIDMISAVADSITTSSLAQWFVDNYICKCAELCPQNMSVLCSDVITSEILQDTVTTILKWKDHIARKAVMKELALQFVCLHDVGDTERFFGVWLPLVISFMTHKMNFMDDLLNFQFGRVSVFLLLYIDFCNIIWDAFGLYPEENRFIDFVSLMAADLTCCSHYERRTILQSTSNLSSSASAFMKAVTYIKYGVRKQYKTSWLLLIELAKMYLLRALRCKDSDSDSIYCVTNVYFAVLCHATGQYQKAADRCILVTRSQDHSQCTSQFVQGNLLPKVDDNVDMALGLAVFYHYIRGTASILHDGLTKHIGIFTTELFAHYFIAKHLLVTKCHIAPVSVANCTVQALFEQLQVYRNRLLYSKHLSVSDLLLCKLPHNFHLLHPIETRITFPRTAAEMIRLLTQHSIEYVLNDLKQLRSLTLHPSVVVDSRPITGLLPLYLYRCRLYGRCLEVCRDSVHALMETDVRLSTSYREFIQLMDNDIVSLMGLAVLVGETAGMRVKLAGTMAVSQLTLTLHLLTESQCKLCSSNTRQAAASSFAVVLDWIADAEKMVPNDNVFDLLILKWTQRKAVTYITKLLTYDNFCSDNTRFKFFRLFNKFIESMLSMTSNSLTSRH